MQHLFSPVLEPRQGGTIVLWLGLLGPMDVIIPATMSSLQYRHGAPLSMVPCAEASHPVGLIRSVGFYPSLASTFPAHYCPLLCLESLLHAITLNNVKLNYDTQSRTQPNELHHLAG